VPIRIARHCPAAMYHDVARVARRRTRCHALAMIDGPHCEHRRNNKREFEKEFEQWHSPPIQ